MSDPVHRHRRNPRRAYDENGREIAPPTVGDARAEGETTAAAECLSCGHGAIVSTDGLPADLPFPDIALKLRCSACGSRQIRVRKDMLAHYARMEATSSWRTGDGVRVQAPEPTAGIGFGRRDGRDP